MAATSLTWLFLVMLAASLAVRFWLSARQRQHVLAHRGEVPAQFRERVGIAAHQRAADYTIAKLRLGTMDTVVGAALLLVLTLGSGLQKIHSYVQALLPDAPLLRQIGLVLAVMLVTSLFELPATIYRQFVLEQRFGFNRMTWRLFVADMLKGVVVGLILGVPLLAAVLVLMSQAGDRWWLWTWFVWVAFNLGVLVIYPTVIAPWFNKFEPLPQGPVRERVEALLGRCGFESGGLFVMDGSRRSAHGNAYFTGLGRSKRIVFFDTLLTKLAPAEIEAVLAHELGHFRHRHVLKRIVWTFAASLAGLALLGLLAAQPWFYEALGMQRHALDWPASALLLFFLVLPVFTFPLQPLFSNLSRRHEFQADAFAAKQTRVDDLVSALVKLYEDNASTLTPDPLHSAYHDSHPPAAQRIAHLLGLRAPAGVPTATAPAN